MAEHNRDGERRVADVIDGVVWDYDPEGEAPSPLVSTQRYFRDFPWEPEEVMVGPAKDTTENE